MSEKKQNGGARPGAGRKKGVVGPKKLKMLKQKDYILNRILDATENLMNAQLAEALGSHTLWCQKYDNKHKKIGKAFPIRDDKVIEMFLNGELEEDKAHEYYMMRKEKPNHKLLISLFDRAIGKPVETQKVIGDKENPIKVTIEKTYANESKNKSNKSNSKKNSNQED